MRARVVGHLKRTLAPRALRPAVANPHRPTPSTACPGGQWQRRKSPPLPAPPSPLAGPRWCCPRQPPARSHPDRPPRSTQPKRNQPRQRASRVGGGGGNTGQPPAREVSAGPPPPKVHVGVGACGACRGACAGRADLQLVVVFAHACLHGGHLVPAGPPPSRACTRTHNTQGQQQ